MNRIIKTKTRKGNDQYVVYYNGKTFSYSVYRYGKFAKKLAEYTLEHGIRLENYYKIKHDHAIIYSDSKLYGVCKIKVDIEDLPKLLNHYWYIHKNRYTLYAENDIIGKMHRYILNADEQFVIDHKNKNGLDNRRKNLRETTISLNNKNAKKRKDNSSGVTGISYDKYKNAYVATYYKNCKKKTKSFSIIKYGNNAFKLACDYRKQKEEENMYYAKCRKLFK